MSKIVASCMADILPHNIHPAQVGFVQGRSAALNIRKVILALEHANSHLATDTAIISLDAEKAFGQPKMTFYGNT